MSEGTFSHVWDQIFSFPDSVLNSWTRQRMIPVIMKNHFRSVLLKQHKHQHIKTKDKKKSMSNLHKLHKSAPNLAGYTKENEPYLNGESVLVTPKYIY